ncbi:hypothetical protein GF325_18355 [Candidatus Bathyarchaeota archaeon]|nr:hypothetical protein [Candidatus Bathyarchaeota archaeon]
MSVSTTRDVSGPLSCMTVLDATEGESLAQGSYGCSPPTLEPTALEPGNTAFNIQHQNALGNATLVETVDGIAHEGDMDLPFEFKAAT